MSAPCHVTEHIKKMILFLISKMYRNLILLKILGVLKFYFEETYHNHRLRYQQCSNLNVKQSLQIKRICKKCILCG